MSQMCRSSALICFGKKCFVCFLVIQAQMKLSLGWTKRVSFIWLLKLLKRMTPLNLSGPRTMRDLQMLTESGLKRKAIGEYPMHTEKMITDWRVKNTLNTKKNVKPNVSLSCP